MRIAIFSEVYPPFVNGIATQVFLLKKALILLGHQVLVVTSDLHTRQFYWGDNVLYCPAEPAKNSFNMGFIRREKETLWELLKDFSPELLHIHTVSPLGILAAEYSGQFNLPVVFSAYDCFTELLPYYSPGFFKKIIRARCRAQLKRILRRSDFVISFSKEMPQEFESYGISHKTELIPCMTDYEKFFPGCAEESAVKKVRERLGLPEEACCSLFAGKIGPEKNIEILIQLWSQQVRENPRLYLLIVGDGPEREILSSWAKKCGVSKNIIFTGEVPYEQMPLYYSLCDFFVSASESGTACTSMMEAIGCGLPVLISAFSHCAFLIRENFNGFVYKNAAEFGYYVRKFASIDEEGKQLLKKTVHKTAKKDSSVLSARYLLSVYEKALLKHLENIRKTN